MTVVIMGGGVWAKGDNVTAAKRAFTAHGGRLSGGYGILTFSADSEFKGVDDMGRYHFTGPEPIVSEVAPRKSARR